MAGEPEEATQVQTECGSTGDNVTMAPGAENGSVGLGASRTTASPSIPFLDLASYHRDRRADLLDAIAAVLESGDFVLGQAVAEFEAAFAQYCEARHAVGVGSGTEALILALQALELPSDSEVILPANTFVATAEAVLAAGFRPVVVDVHPYTYNLDVDAFERAITPRTRAVLPVHLYGRPADMGGVLDVARRYGLRVVEDACQAHGARWAGRRVGALGDVGCFSFYPGKNLGALGDGGAVVTNDDVLAERVRELRNHGGIRKYEHRRLGTTSRLDSMQAAVLAVKLGDLDERNERRRAVAAAYDRALAGSVATPPAPAVAPDEHVYHLYVVRVPADLRDKLLASLVAAGIGTGIHYPLPIHAVESMRGLGYGPGAFPVAEALSREIVSLPMYPELLPHHVQRVADEIHRLGVPRPIAESVRT